MYLKNETKEVIFSFRFYKGDLHVHTKDDPEDIKEIAKKRIGSNCAHARMEDVLDYKLSRAGLEYVAITNHSRDAASVFMGEGFVQWLTKGGLERSEATRIAEDVHKYDDERLIKERKLIDRFRAKYGKRIIAGVEANIMTNGGFDTRLIDEDFFDFVVASIHPWNFRKKPNFREYQKMLLVGIENPKTNVIAHIGYGYHFRFVHKLDWDLIARECIVNQVALEVNLAWILDLIENECMKGKSSYKILAKTFKQMSRKVPIFSHRIFEILSEYFPMGLRLAVNTDFHLLDRKLYLLENKNFLYLRVLKGLEMYINDFFQLYGVQRNSIINQLSRDDLQMFIDKEYYF